MSEAISLRAQVEEIQNVVAGRERAIRYEVSRGQMRAAVADLHVARMRAALKTMNWLLKHEAAIKAKVDAAGGQS